MTILKIFCGAETLLLIAFILLYIREHRRFDYVCEVLDAEVSHIRGLIERVAEERRKEKENNEP